MDHHILRRWEVDPGWKRGGDGEEVAAADVGASQGDWRRAVMCVIMYNMKTATVRQVQHNFSEVLSWVERGEEVRVLRRKNVVARLLPPDPRPVASPDFLGRARAVWGETPPGAPLSQVVSESRGER